MPIYEYEGVHYDIDTSDHEAARKQILAHLGKSEGAKQVPQDAADFTRGLANIVPQWENVASSAKALTGVAAKKMGFDKAGDEMIASGLEGMKKAEAKMQVKESDEFLNAWDKGIGTVITDWLPYQAGAGVGSLLETLAYTGIGAAAGAATGAGVGAAPGAVAGFVSKSLIKKGIKEAAEELVKKGAKEEAEALVQAEAKKVLINAGKNIGMGTMAATHGLGEVGGRAIEEVQKQGLTAEDIELNKVLPAAVVHGIADFVSEKIMLGALKPGTPAGRSFTADILKRIAVTGGKELPAEEVQTIAERYGANLSLTDAEAVKDYINTGAAAFGMSIVPGGAGAVHSRLTGNLKENLKAEEEAKTTGTNVATTTTTAAPPPLDPELAAKLQPTVDADGTPLAKASPTTVAATEEVNEVLDQGAQFKQEEAPKESIYEVPKKEAADYLATIESQTVKPNASILKKHVRALGLEVPAGAGFSERAIEAIKVNLGAQNVPVTDTTTGGASAQVSGQQAAGVPVTAGQTTPAGGATTTVGQGLAGTAVPTSDVTGGAPAQQPPLAPTATSQAAPPPVATPAFTPAAPTQVSTGFTSEDQLRQAMIEEDQRKAAEEEQNRLAFEEAQFKRIPPTKVAPEIKEEYDGTREEMENAIPAWEDLTADEKDVYLENIRQNTIEEHRAAGQALADYRDSKGRGAGYATSQLMPGEQRAINMYEQNRKTYSEQMGIEFPSWLDLSGPARNAYLNEVTNNTPIEQDFGFMELATQLETEGKGVRGAAKVDLEKAKLAGQSEESKVAIQERTAKERAAEESALGKGEPLPQEAIDLLKTDVNGFLEWLSANGKGLLGLKPAVGDKTYRRAATELAKTRNKAIEIIFKYLGARLSRIDFTGMAVVTENNPMLEKLRKEGKLAEYHPKTNVLYITKEGLDQATVIHELIHAATVKLISRYYSNPSLLRPEEREAIEHLEKLFDFTKKQLGGKFKNAYENIYEFVSYGLTDNKFQLALSQIQARPLAKYTLMMKNAWRQFTQALSKMFGLYDAKASKEELPAEMYQQVAKEYSSMDPNELYNEKVMEEMEELDIVITPPTLAEPKPKEQDIKVKKVRVPTQAEKFITIAPGFEGNVLLEMAEVFERIASAPVPVAVQPLAAQQTGAAPAETKKPAFREDDLTGDAPSYDPAEKHMPKNIRYITRLFTTAPGWRQIATKFQNNRYDIKHWQDVADLAGKIIDVGRDKMNNIYTQLTLAASAGRNYYNQYVKDIDEKLEQSVINFAKAANLEIPKAINKLYRIAEALHDTERRHEKFLMIVPLKNDKVLNNGTLSPADRRNQIYEILDSGAKLSEAQLQQLKAELEAIVKAYADPLGSSPREIVKKDGTKSPLPIDQDNELYNVSGLSPAARDLRLQQLNDPSIISPKERALVDEVMANMAAMHQATAELNKIGNYWSQPVSNRVGFYGFKNYIPLKGTSAFTEDELLDYDSERMGRELQEGEYSFEGRTTPADNPILQTRADATRAALRAGRKDLTQSIKNAITKDANGKQLLAGHIKKTLTFAERRNSDELSKLKGESTIFHYNEDGSIDVLVVNNRHEREAIRRTYQDTNPIVDMANKATSFLGALHTRYNYNFAPMNFVRDALTNAFTMSADMGPAEAARYIKAIAGRSMQGGMTKAINISVAYEKGDMAALERMKKTDPIAADMIEFIERGGMVSYLQGLSIKSNLQSLQKEIGRSGIVRKKEQLDKFIDVWTDMFELSSRSAAYAVTKQAEMAKGKSEEAATVRAVAYAKNLANFEQVGDWGKALGAFYMFFRPSATGAVRAIESVIPAFRKLEDAVKALPESISSDPEAVKTFRENYAAKQKNARTTIAAAMGLGMITYAMAQMLADDDDLGRNKVEADNMQQWTRFARFHIPKGVGLGDDLIIQIPWGFGLGAFAASGAQLAGGLAGKGSMGDALWNIGAQISLDSFVPIPVSRMDPTETPWAFMLDSLMPSAFRPILEFVINKNGLGQSIYSDSNRRMGDAYTGGDKVPGIYRALSRELASITGGGIDWSPNTIYFLANSYMDGISKVGELGYGGIELMTNNKSFDPKTDTPLLSSFIGSKSNYDSREFSKVESQVKEMERILNMFKEDPVEYAKYVSKHPFAEVLVESYNSNVNGSLKDIRQQLNEYRRMQGLTSKERKQLVDALTLQQNIIKRGMIEEFKAYGVKP